MPHYRRNRVEGGTYFFTVALADRRSDLLVREIAALRAAVARTRMMHPFTIDAWVVLPEHMHAVWTLPEGDADFSTRWTLVKRTFSATIPSGEERSASRLAKEERGIWQRRFWEHTVRDPEDFARHVDYVHFNPVKRGLAPSAAAWPFSSFRRPVARGHYPAEWAYESEAVGEFGERAEAEAVHSDGWLRRLGFAVVPALMTCEVGCESAPYPALAFPPYALDE